MCRHQNHWSFGFTWFLWPLWCDRPALFFYFERRYQKSSTSLKLRLVVWNHKFQRGHNPSSFKLPLCGISKTWTNIGFLSICCSDKVTGWREAIIQPLDVVHSFRLTGFSSKKKQLTLKVMTSSNLTVRRYLWITARDEICIFINLVLSDLQAKV